MALAETLSYNIALQLICRWHGFLPPRAAFVPWEESKVVSSHSRMLNVRRSVRALIFGLLVTVFSSSSVCLAFGQGPVDFTLGATPLQPQEVEPGGISTAIVDLQLATGITQGSPVSLSCVVTSTQTTENLPACTPSPVTATPPADGPSLTVATESATAAGLYTITVTGTDSSGSQTLSLNLNVVPSTSDYTLSVTRAPDPNNVTAGHGAQATVTLTPIGSYQGNVTLSCLSITPVVLDSPVCSFSPSPAVVAGGVPATSVLTITTFGPSNTVAKLGNHRWNPRRNPKMFYALFLAVPGLLVVGTGTTGKPRRKLLGLLGLVAVAGGLLLLPACNATSSTSSPTSPTGQVTPKNTYTFTLSGVDQTGGAPSNGTTGVTVTLTVD